MTRNPALQLTIAWSGWAAGVVATLALAVAGAALAEQRAGDPVTGTPLTEEEAGGPAILACTVSGYDVIVRNRGTKPIASGASVDWSVPFARMTGGHVLTEELEPGGRVFLTGALGSNFLGSESECKASLGQPVAPQ